MGTKSLSEVFPKLDLNFTGGDAGDSSLSNEYYGHIFSSARTPRGDSIVIGGGENEVPSTVNQEPDVIFDAQHGFNRYSHYVPVHITPGLPIERTVATSFHANLMGSQLNIPGWRYELQHENDLSLRQYLSWGVEHGFYIVDVDAKIAPYENKNYNSVLIGEPHKFVDNLIKAELDQGKYVMAKDKPWCIHSIGAVPKKAGGWRPITDCKRPIGASINSFMTTTYKEFCYTTVDNVIDLIQPGWYMASVDISAAYRSILIHPSQWKYQGVAWPIGGVNRYMYDTHICFGLRCAPYLFTQVSNFVLRCLHRRGFTSSLVYLDDFLVLGRDRQECSDAQITLIGILRSLGFYIAWKKCVTPTQSITYLEIEFNSVNMSVSLPKDKMQRLLQEIEFFVDKSRASKRQVQRLCGILAHCAKVVKGGRTFSQRVINLLKGWPVGRKRIRLSTEFKYDIFWWKCFAENFNGKNLMVKFNYGQGPSFYTD